MIQNTLIVNNGIDTSNATATAGDVSSGTKRAPKQLTTHWYSNKLFFSF